MSLPALVAVVASIALLYVVGARMFHDRRWGVVSAAIFASTPLIWRQLGSDPASLYVLPSVVGWLAATTLVGDFGPVVAGIVLGAGVYASYSAAVLAPLYAALTIAVRPGAMAESLRRVAMFFVAFVVVSSPFALSLLFDHERYRRVVARSHLYDASRFNLLQGFRETASWVSLTARTDVYYSYFDPAFLFLRGGVLLWPLVVLIPAGLYRIGMSRRTPTASLSLGGFLLAPFAAALTAEAPVAGRILLITPFAAMVSVFGARQLLSVVESIASRSRTRSLS